MKAHPSLGPYNALYAFGDSYSDIGARYVDSDGPTAVAYLAEHMGLSITHPQDPAAADRSLVFAASGATSGRELSCPDHMINGKRWCGQGMADQVDEFVRKIDEGSITFDPMSTLFFIAGGLNDRNLPTATSIFNIRHQILLLADVGAYHVSLALLPTKIPAFSDPAKRLNPAYRDLVAELRAYLHIDLQLNHWGPFFDEVISNPSVYGILNTTSPCAGRALFNEDETPCLNPGTYYYYHEGHPSTKVHRIVGEKLYKEICHGIIGQELRISRSDRI